MLDFIFNVIVNLICLYFLLTTVYFCQWPLKAFWYWIKGDKAKFYGTNWVNDQLDKDKDKDKI
jgi:hypothetical protein